MKVTLQWNRSIGELKVKWEHFGLYEATWELEDFMKETYTLSSNFEEHRGRCYSKG